METSFTSRGDVRYWQKFAIVLVVGLVLLIAGTLIKNDFGLYLCWGAGTVLAISAWYAIMSVFEFFDKLS